MDKKQIIKKLNELRDHYNDRFGGSPAGNWTAGGVIEAIALIEQMEEEPITAAALEAAGWLPSNYVPGSIFYKHKGDLIEIAIVLENSAPAIVSVKTRNGTSQGCCTNMAQLCTLVEVFLS